MKHVLTLLLAGILLAGCATTRTYFTDAKTIGPYSPAVKVGNFLYVSGQIAMKPGTTELAGDDIESQARQVLENVKSNLAKAGYEMSDVVQCTVYLKDMADFAKMNQIYSSFFQQGQYPTRTTVEVSNLPAKARIEITAVACK
ncbi:MAG TPA: RidA family protein [Bacteroidota bacterium]|nr:RidA family protein [Bacteroidota bacterium]